MYSVGPWLACYKLKWSRADLLQEGSLVRAYWPIRIGPAAHRGRQGTPGQAGHKAWLRHSGRRGQQAEATWKARGDTCGEDRACWECIT